MFDTNSYELRKQQIQQNLKKQAEIIKNASRFRNDSAVLDYFYKRQEVPVVAVGSSATH